MAWYSCVYCEGAYEGIVCPTCQDYKGSVPTDNPNLALGVFCDDCKMQIARGTEILMVKAVLTVDGMTVACSSLFALCEICRGLRTVTVHEIMSVSDERNGEHNGM